KPRVVVHAHSLGGDLPSLVFRELYVILHKSFRAIPSYLVYVLLWEVFAKVVNLRFVGQNGIAKFCYEIEDHPVGFKAGPPLYASKDLVASPTIVSRRLLF